MTVVKIVLTLDRKQFLLLGEPKPIGRDIYRCFLTQNAANQGGLRRYIKLIEGHPALEYRSYDGGRTGNVM